LKALYGVTVNSLSSVQLAIENRLGKDSCKLIAKGKKYSSKKVLLIPNVNSLRSNLKYLEAWNGVAIVFDSPINLYGIKRLKWLDVKRNEDVLSYKFQFIEPAYEKLFAAYEAKEKAPPIKLKKLDILRALVVQKSDTPFLEKFSNFLYFCTSHLNREMCKKLLIEYFNNQLTVDQLKNNWSKILRPDQVDYYQKEFLDWLKSSDGDRLKKAWLSVEDKDCTKAVKKHDVNLQDLRFIQRTAKNVKEKVREI